MPRLPGADGRRLSVRGSLAAMTASAPSVRLAALLLAVACSAGSSPPAAPDWAPPGDGRDFPDRLVFPLPLAADREPRSRRVAEEPGYVVSHVEFRVFDVPGTDGWRATGALFEPLAREAGAYGVVVGTGHFGQGKSAPESQEIAHRLAAVGARVLVVDAPGMEDQDVRGRWIHFDRGAHHRAWLAAAAGDGPGGHRPLFVLTANSRPLAALPAVDRLPPRLSRLLRPLEPARP